MAYDEILASRVRAALQGSGPVEEKKMFGGLAFLLRKKMCVSVGRDRIMCRIDPELHDAALQHKGCRTVTMRGREYRGFVHVDKETVKTQKQLDYWIRLALEYNKKAKASKRK